MITSVRSNEPKENDSIVALSTPIGVGAIAVVRLSGKEVPLLTQAAFGFVPKPRVASLLALKDRAGHVIDEGLVIYFPAPHSFTGETVLEFQGHGGRVLADLVIQRFMELGARLARPGEFSERAFLNQKLDLVQAEAIADLIQAQSAAAARAAVRSLQGAFSDSVNTCLEKIIQLRMMMESSIDFSDEDIPAFSNALFSQQLQEIKEGLLRLLEKSRSGILLSEGADLVIAGKPNAGKSSLLNRLAEEDRAIVTDVPGTTRDILKENWVLEGIPLKLIDTAGLRETADKVEHLGILRAKRSLETADFILLVIDSLEDQNTPLVQLFPELGHWLEADAKLLLIYNKIDLLGLKPKMEDKVLEIQGKNRHAKVIYLSVAQNKGIDLLKRCLLDLLGVEGGLQEDGFLARRRQIDQLEKTLVQVETASLALSQGQGIELVAEELRLAQLSMDEITGRFSSDDLLGEIFSHFCIGK